MNVVLNFSNYKNYHVDDNRLSRIVMGDEKNAIKISVWEKIKDFFRTDKKGDAYQTLYQLIHKTDNGNALDAFNRLKSFANEEHQKHFRKEIYSNDVLFFVGEDVVAQRSLQELMNVSENTRLHSMSMPEQQLFLNMLDTLREKELLYSDSYPKYIRKQMADEHGDEIMKVYRPQESVDDPGIELSRAEFMSFRESKPLKHLHAHGKMYLPAQFSSMGYQKTTLGVEFTMLHPSISYLLHSYVNKNSDSLTAEMNSDKLHELNNIYDAYNYHKNDIDKVLNKVYQVHGGTLNISYSGRNGNNIIA